MVLEDSAGHTPIRGKKSVTIMNSAVHFMLIFGKESLSGKIRFHFLTYQSTFNR
jgi:hypothetical protein